jgi:hypothetical protein
MGHSSHSSEGKTMTLTDGWQHQRAGDSKTTQHDDRVWATDDMRRQRACDEGDGRGDGGIDSGQEEGEACTKVQAFTHSPFTGSAVQRFTPVGS